MKKIKISESRAASFVILAVIYLIAAACGIVSFIYLPFDIWLKLLLADKKAF